MSSYLDKQTAAFKGDLTSVASKIPKKSSSLAAPASSAPSPAPSSSVSSKPENKDAKRKREPAAEVYSQPAATGFGTDAFTQVTYVIEYLKNKDEPKTFQEIIEYLSLMHAEQHRKTVIASILKKHPKIQWHPDPQLKTQTWDSGKFAHCPTLAVRSGQDLIAYLQKKPDAQGVKVSDLKDGWPDCESTINELEKSRKILVTRTKKDNHAKSVWPDDLSLHHPVDAEFKDMWYKIELPSVDDLVRSLLDVGQKPASEDPAKRVKAMPKPKDKKRKAPRRGGKATNTHMQHLLKDYAHMRR